jgi:hypothetical protein
MTFWEDLEVEVRVRTPWNSQARTSALRSVGGRLIGKAKRLTLRKGSAGLPLAE